MSGQALCGGWKGVLGHILVSSVVAFVLHFLWESAQCIPFFVHRYERFGFVPTMVRAATGDILLTWISVAAVALTVRDARWVRNVTRRRTLVVLTVVNVVLAIAVERYALSAGRWSYTEINPVIPMVDVSLLPVLQLVLLVPLTFVIANRLRKRPAACQSNRSI